MSDTDTDTGGETAAAKATARKGRGRGRNAKTQKAERIPVNRLSQGEREQAMNAARTSSSGQGQDASKGVAAAKAAGRGGSRLLNRGFKRRTYKVLYFIDTPSPTKEQFEEAQSIGPGVVFRNARKIVLGAPLENADAVAGPAIPPDYADFYREAGEGDETDDDDRPERLVSRPRPSPQGGMNPDDARPGTVDDGLAHASGTGSSQPGLRNADPTQQPVGPGPIAKSEERQLASEWKTGKTAAP